MSIDVTIRQKGIFKKVLPLEVILGERLSYGCFMNDSLTKKLIGSSEFVAYNPEHIGRGFSVIWSEKERSRVSLRLPQPSTPDELREFYDSVSRIVKYWNASLTVDGSKVSLDEFTGGYSSMVEFNEKIIKQFSQSVLDGENDTLTVYATMWPLHIGRDEAALFISDPSAYYSWLHEKQDVDAEYASVRFYYGDSGIIGRYFITPDRAYIFPKTPHVPFGITDSDTGKALECSDFRVCLMNDEGEEPFGELGFSDFLTLLSGDKVISHDSGLLLISAFSKDELSALTKEAE